MPPYLTKSRFKLGLDCPPKLYYSSNKGEYGDQNIEDPFLTALAEGGFQVGELAKFLFSEDPVAEGMTIEERDNEKALAITRERLFKSDTAILAEAAFCHENLLVRVDITTRKGKLINLYEVKAKSWNKDKDFWKQNKRDGSTYLDKDWLPYLYDIAFQKYVVAKALPGYTINAFLILADSDAPAEIEGLNQHFRINKNGSTRITVASGTTKTSLGNIPLKVLPVDRECDWIYQNPVTIDLEEEIHFEALINRLSHSVKTDERIWSSLGTKCRDCQFKSPDNQFKSGFNECWQHVAGLNPDQLKQPLALELWGGLAGARSIVNLAIQKGKYFLSDIEESDISPNGFEPRPSGLHPTERRLHQITKSRKSDNTFFLDRRGLEEIFEKFSPPYHFIDFETTAIALPFHKGRKPYEAIAFQYSYHLVQADGSIAHQSQYLSLEPGFPNYDFVRALRADLEGKEGTIFRYHNHENTYLCKIREQLKAEAEEIASDKTELINFIEQITHGEDRDGEWKGDQDMVDLWKLVLSYYYSPKAKGSNSIKDILPAVIHDSNFIRDKYTKPVYGTREIPSLNFKNHVWIAEESENNPYKTLPGVLDRYTNEYLDQFVPVVEDIRDGGAAMMAYAYLQFTDVPESQKEHIRNALLRYCELDTMAMVMIWEFWGNEIGRFGK